MITLYYNPSPNPAKVALFLEEAGLEYELAPIDIRKGDQFEPAFLKINPNGKTPALTDGDIPVFDSSAILLYLAQKTGKFGCDDTDAARAQMLSWMLFVASGVGPYFGQAVHFTRFAPEKLPYAINRYVFEAERHWGIVDKQLEGRRYMLGDRYSIVDMSVWGWGRLVPILLGPETWEKLPNVKRLVEEISARPAAERVAELGKRHVYKTEMDEESHRNMFPQNERLAST